MSEINISLLSENQNLSKFEIADNLLASDFLIVKKKDLNLNLISKKEPHLTLF